MGTLFLVVVGLAALFISVFGGSAILYFVSRWFKQNLSYRTSVKILVLAGILSYVVNIVLGILLALAGAVTALIYLADFIVAFFIFHFFFKKYSTVNSWKKSLGIYVVSALGWFVLTWAVVLPVRLWVFQPFLVSGEAMNPTYPSGEYLLINEFSKNFSRGDVVVFRYPVDPSEYFIKRIVGLPGETLTVKNGQVTINGEVLNEPYIATTTPGDTSLKLGPEEYFVMGDNRQVSNDSRSFGSIQKSSILGKVLFDVTKF